MKITPEQAEEWTQANAQVLGGGFRLVKLSLDMGIAKSLGMTQEDYVNERLGGYTRYAIKPRREIVAELDGEGYTTRQIAEILGVNQSTVVRDLHPGDANASHDPDHKAVTSRNTGHGDAKASRDTSGNDDEIIDAELVDDDTPGTEVTEYMPPPEGTNPNTMSLQEITVVFTKVNSLLEKLHTQTPPPGHIIGAGRFFNIADELRNKGWK